jgi:D-amino-acid dehydrogenase
MPSAEQDAVRHVAVIGAGTVGSSCAWHLRKAGFEVTLIDPVPPGQSTSYGNAACIKPSHIVPFSYPGVTRQIPGWLFDRLGPLFIRWRDLPGLLPWFWRFWRSGSREGAAWAAAAQARLMKRVTPDFDEILDATGSSHLRRSMGVISVWDSRDEFEAGSWRYEIKESHGFEWELIGPAELKIMAPELRIGEGVAVFHPDWQHLLDPAEVTRRIAESCFAAGGSWLQDRVSHVEARASGIVLATESGQKVEADALVIAAGAWSNLLAKRLDRAVPMTAKRGYHAMVGQPGIELDYPVVSMSRSFVMTPMKHGLRFAGTAEFARLDAEPDYDRAKVLLEHGKHYLPNLECRDVEEWMGQRPMMADSVPVISRSPSKGNVFYAFGHGHFGLTQGPTTGRIITALVGGREPDVEIADYRFDRF